MGLEQSTIPLTLCVFAGLIAVVDIYSLKLKDEQGDDWLPGDFGFDPLNLLGGATIEAKRDMQEKEINNGRLAMMAVLVYVIEEAVTKLPIVKLTPWLFKPVIADKGFQELFDQFFAISAFRAD